MQKKADKDQPSEMVQTMRYLSLVGHLGLVMIFSVGGGLALGLFLDRWLETKAIFTVVLLLVGVGAGFANTYRTICLMDVPEKRDFKRGEKSGIYNAHHGNGTNSSET